MKFKISLILFALTISIFSASQASATTAIAGEWEGHMWTGLFVQEYYEEALFETFTPQTTVSGTLTGSFFGSGTYRIFFLKVYLQSSDNPEVFTGTYLGNVMYGTWRDYSQFGRYGNWILLRSVD
ncbi:hypothetical protein GF312_19590, partial [Candidatus Poribacteria bacterium]|nr:hypothetical protein [Candidatus Poribacteria bacterium]